MEEKAVEETNQEEGKRRKRIAANASSILDNSLLPHLGRDYIDKERHRKNMTYEEQILLKLPERLQHLVDKGIEQNKESIFHVEFEDERNGVITVGDENIQVHIEDLPCILESFKTLNDRQFFKISDISQIIVPVNEDNVHKTKSPHGVTKPMSFVRKRRFRKSLRKVAEELTEIERSVQKLLEKDREAVRVEFDLVEEPVVITSEEDSDDSSLAAEIEHSLINT